MRKTVIALVAGLLALVLANGGRCPGQNHNGKEHYQRSRNDQNPGSSAVLA